MGVFYSLFFLIIAVEFLTRGMENSNKNIRLCKTLLYGLATWLVLALRSPQNGTDLVAYCARFPRFANYSLEDCFHEMIHWSGSGFEPGFVLLNKLITLFSTDVQVFLAVTSFLTILPITTTIYKYSKSIYLSFIIFICFGLFNMCFTGLRQSLAFGITFWSSQFIIERKPIKFMLALLLAMSFHMSAMFFGIMYFAPKFNINKKNAVWIFAGYLCVLLVAAKLLFTQFATLFFDDKYQHYMSESDGAYNLAFIYIVIFFWGLFSGYPKKGLMLNVIKIAVFMGMCIQCVCIFGLTGVARMGFYFSIFYSLYIPVVLREQNHKTRAWMEPLILVLFIAFHYLTTSGGTFSIVPYHFFWEPGFEEPNHYTF